MRIYCATNIGLAVPKSWLALFLLHVLQSAHGDSKDCALRNSNILTKPKAILAMGYGVVSDIATPAERGGFVDELLLG